MSNRPAVLVTGGGSGIGLESARALAGSGWDVAICGRRLEVVGEAADDHGRQFPDVEVKAFSADIGKTDEAEGVVKSTIEAFGRLDALVNCAGAYKTIPFDEMTVEAWDAVNDVLARGTAVATIAATKHMVANGGGRVVFVGSVNAIVSEYGSSQYAAAKSAMHSLARSVAVDLGHRGVTANVVASGFVKTPMTRGLHEHEDQEMAQAIIRRINPLGRAGEAHEIANVVRYLVAEAPTYLTGSTIVVDGAQTVHGGIHNPASDF